jgi:hypothetical protein
MPDGLYAKYEVRKDGAPVEECFVLEPEEDAAARRALETYAEETDDEELAQDLRVWLAAIAIEQHGMDADGTAEVDDA